MSILNLGKKPEFNPEAQRKLDYDLLPEPDPRLIPGTPEFEAHLNKTYKNAELMSYIAAVVECPKSVHHPGKAIFACDHCVRQDLDKPVGIVCTPFKFYLCTECFNRHSYRRLDLARELKVTCWQCILDEIRRIQTIDPSKYRDVLKDKAF
jgi:hypothetical protein